MRIPRGGWLVITLAACRGATARQDLAVDSTPPLLATASAASLDAPLEPKHDSKSTAGIAVRYPEGMAHGFVELTTPAGKVLASGDLLQLQKGDAWENQLVFRFRDSSYFSQTTVFTQSKVFALKSYHLVQRGPAFERDLDALVSANGRYLVTSKSHNDREVKRYEGTMELPPDIANGLPTILLKNLAPGDTQTVHLLAFTPKPRMIKLEMAPAGTERVSNSGRSQRVTRYVLKPRLGGLTTIMAKVLGKMPPDSYAWIVTEDVPAFVKFEGPLFDGPVWRIVLTAPSW